MKESKEEGTKLIDCMSLLASRTVTDDNRQEVEDLLVAARSQHNAAMQSITHRDTLIEELCIIANRLTAIWDEAKTELEETKAKVAKQAGTVASLRKKLLHEIGSVRESVKRKASTTAVPDINEWADFKTSYDDMVAENEKKQEENAAEIQEVIPAIWQG